MFTTLFAPMNTRSANTLIMRFISLTLLLTLLCLSTVSLVVSAQPPQRPLIPLAAYTLEGYSPIDVSTAFNLPAHIEFSSVTSVDFNSKGHLIVLHRSAQPFLEFDGDGNFIRAFGADGLFVRSHGLSIDADDNMWTTDVAGHVVMKLNADGEILMTLGTLGQSGDWNDANGSRFFSQPNDVALDSDGNIYVAQGHGPSAEPKILKFNSNGEFINQWGGFGEGPGQFAVAHSIEIDADNNIYVADRENFRVQIFNTAGQYLSQWKFNAMACAIYLHDDGFMYMTTGFDGELAKLDMDGQIIGAIGSPGRENGQFGEGHFLTANQAGDVFIADVVNRRVQLYKKD